MLKIFNFFPCLLNFRVKKNPWHSRCFQKKNEKKKCFPQTCWIEAPMYDTSWHLTLNLNMSGESHLTKTELTLHRRPKFHSMHCIDEYVYASSRRALVHTIAAIVFPAGVLKYRWDVFPDPRNRRVYVFLRFCKQREIRRRFIRVLCTYTYRLSS